jgi:heptaprenylglyceryl phosphate synthase
MTVSAPKPLYEQCLFSTLINSLNPVYIIKFLRTASALQQLSEQNLYSSQIFLAIYIVLTSQSL